MPEFKLGMKVYCETTMSIVTGEVTREVKKWWVVKTIGNGVFIDKRTGYQRGSRGTGHYGSFSARYWYPMTVEKQFKVNRNTLVGALCRLRLERLVETVTQENVHKVIDAYNLLKTLTQK